MIESIKNGDVMNSSNHLHKDVKTNYTFLLNGIIDELKDDYERIKKSLNTLPDENTDLEPYEGTPIEDLFTGCYLTGKMEILDEIIELIEVEQLKIK